jgi:hypothetical protein
MAKRYGRNQKRQARQKIAELERKNDGLQRSAGDLIHKIAEYHVWAKRVERLVPKYSVLNKDVMQDHRENDPGPEFDIANIMRMSTTDIRAFNDEMQVSNIERLRMYVMQIESRPEDFRRGQRFELRIGRTGAVYYAVDDDYLQMQAIMEDGDALRWISSEIAHGMIKHLDKIKR